MFPIKVQLTLVIILGILYKGIPLSYDENNIKDILK